jgi:hypothetical protein
MLLGVWFALCSAALDRRVETAAHWQAHSEQRLGANLVGRFPRARSLQDSRRYPESEIPGPESEIPGSLRPRSSLPTDRGVATAATLASELESPR